jgi:hypothetical protein
MINKPKKGGNNMDFYTEEEEDLMTEFQCSINKAVISLEGFSRKDPLTVVEKTAEKIAKGDPYIQKVSIHGGSLVVLLIRFLTEEGMRNWLKRFPGDIRFIEKDWGEHG